MVLSETTPKWIKKLAKYFGIKSKYRYRSFSCRCPRCGDESPAESHNWFQQSVTLHCQTVYENDDGDVTFCDAVYKPYPVENVYEM